jgi:pimeloyl-ACP methyl ester carboxylesterase
MPLPPHTSHYVNSGDVTIHYRLFGHEKKSAGKTPMLVLHGAAYFDSYDWAYVASKLASDREVAAMDMRGFGKSSWSPSKDYSTDAKLDDMRAIMADRGWSKIVPMVHSMTGRIGIIFTDAYPDLVERLVVCDSATGSNRGAGEGGKLNEAPAIYKSIEELMKAFVRTSQSPRIAHDRERAEAAARKVEGGYILTRDPDMGSVAPQWPGIRTPKLNDVEIWDALARIRCPIRVVRGLRSDRYTPDAIARIKAYKTVTMTEVDSEHDLPGQAPDALVATVKEFLSR